VTDPTEADERDLLDRLLVRAPGLAGPLAGGVRGLRLGTPLRRRLVNLQVKRAFAAMARSDLDVLLLSYEHEAEVWMRSMAGVGISDCYRGHEGIRTLFSDLDDAFSTWAWTPRGVADRGDAFAVKADFVGYGRVSGAETRVSDGGTAVKLSARGLVTWQEWFAEREGWHKALAAVGLPE